MPLYCDTTLPAHQEDCCVNSPGRIIGVAYIRSDSTISDYTSTTEWNNEITAGRIFIIKCVRGDKPKSSPNSIDGFGREQTRTVSRNFTMNYKYANVNDNIDFHNSLNYNSGFRVAYYTQEGTVYVVSENKVDHDADYVIEEGLDSIVTWDITDTWSDQDMPLGFNVSSTVFE